MRAHEAGALHATGYGGPPTWLPYPTDVNELLPQLWSSTVTRDAEGRLTVAGVDAASLAREHGTPTFVLDETDFRARAREFRDAFWHAFDGISAGADVYYAAKAFLCTAVARWLKDEGLSLDVCSGGELAVAKRVSFPPARIGFHGNNKSVAELRSALEYGVGRIIVDSSHEIERLVHLARELNTTANVMIRVTVGVEAHTHEFIATAHEDQKFGFSLSGGAAAAAIEQVLHHPKQLTLLGLHSHIGSQIFDTSGFELAVHRLVALHAQTAQRYGIHLPELDLGGGYGIAYTSQHTPLAARDIASQLASVVRREFAAYDTPDAVLRRPRISIEPGRAIAGPAAFTLYEVGTIKDVALDDGVGRRYVSVDGGMSDNIRTALYDADYSCTIANRRSDAQPQLCRVVGKHCESGDIVVMDEYLPADLQVGDLIAVPGTGAYCRSMASQYNHVPRPPVVAVRDGASATLIRRETIDDILALDCDEGAR